MSYGEIKSLKFQLITENDIRNMAAVKITQGQMYSTQTTTVPCKICKTEKCTEHAKQSTSVQPVEGGPYDARMGTSGDLYDCQLCKLSREKCAGHYGYLDVKFPLAMPLFIQPIVRWLKIVCFNCGSLLIETSKISSTVKKLQKLSELKPFNECRNCGEKQPKIYQSKEDNYSIITEVNGNPIVLNTVKMKEWLSRITLENAKLLGATEKTHPSNFICNSIPIPPVSIRPGIKINTNQSMYGSINTLVTGLVNTNKSLPDRIEETDPKKSTLQMLFHEMIKSTKGNNKRSIIVGNKSEGVLDKIPRKEGLIRFNIMGKRTWNIARSTISGNSAMRIDELGIPQLSAKIMQIEEIVQKYNFDAMLRLYNNGSMQYPGSTIIIRKETGQKYLVDNVNQKYPLEYGDIIYRDIQTGDLAYFNRQPSLERSSVGVHKLVVLNDPNISTLQMNVLSCPWYNADFDGDQMNTWAPSTNMARAEAGILSSVSNWAISTKDSSPIIGQIQDSTIGSLLITRENVRIDQYHALQLFANTNISVDLRKMPKILTGRQIIEIFLKHTPINYSNDTKWFAPIYSNYIEFLESEKKLVIENGKFISGVFDKKSVGSGAKNGIHHKIIRQYGTKKGMESVFNLQQIVLEFLGQIGFTVSANDMFLPKSAVKNIHNSINELLAESKSIDERFIHNELIPPLGVSIKEYYENLQINALRPPDKLMQYIISNIVPETNGLFRMIAAGSKGSNPNLMHILALIGQVTINTKRIGNKLCPGRSLIYSSRFDLDAKSHGFITNPYISGITVSEFVYAMMNGRYDLISKALSTSSTGYINRETIFALQSCIVNYTRSVTMHKRVVQWLYGEDGIDARFMENVKFAIATWNDEKMKSEFDEKSGELEEMMNYRNKYRENFLKLHNIDYNYGFKTSCIVSVNIAELLSTIKSEGEDKSLDEKYKLVADYCNELRRVFVNPWIKSEKIHKIFHSATFLVRIQIKTEFRRKKLTNINYTRLRILLDVIQDKYSKSLIQYGEAVGMLAAQAVSEPLTQYMLDSHHRSVKGGTNKSGIIRPKEIFGVREVHQEKSSEMTIRVKERWDDQIWVNKVASTIELVNMKQFIISLNVIYETCIDLTNETFKSDSDWMDESKIYELENIDENMKQNNKLCFRYEIDKSSLLHKNIELSQIIISIKINYPNAIIFHSDQNEKNIYIRIFMPIKKYNETLKEMEILVKSFEDMVINGISGIISTRVEKANYMRIQPDGSLKSVDEYVIKTNGTNLVGVGMHPHVDETTLISNSIGDTLYAYGIEAARHKIISEIRHIVPNPNDRHIMIYADTMTITGQITSLKANGIKVRESKNSAMRMSFSDPVLVIYQSTLENNQCDLYGIAGPTLLGTVPKIGSLYTEIVMDTDFIQKNAKSIDSFLMDL